MHLYIQIQLMSVLDWTDMLSSACHVNELLFSSGGGATMREQNQFYTWTPKR